jgi:hypothetical protein
MREIERSIDAAIFGMLGYQPSIEAVLALRARPHRPPGSA